MSLFGNGNQDEERNIEQSYPEQHPEEKDAGAREQPVTPEHEYWGKTTPYGYGQGYQQQPPPYNQSGYIPPYPPNQGYGAYPPDNQYRPPSQPYQYSPGSGWQQPQQRPQENYQWNFQDYEKASGSKAKKKRNRGLVVFIVALICVLSAGLVGISAYGVYNYVGDKQLFSDSSGSGERESSSSAEANTDAKLEIVSAPQITESLPVGGKMTIPQVAQAVSPSVVGVIQYQPDMYLSETGEGSGIVLSADGYVITNAHVVEGGTAFKIILSDGTPKDAELIGKDVQTDLAVLKVQGVTDLIPAVFGDSTKVAVGETVLAIGNPGGNILAGSVTQGIISAVNRTIPRTSGSSVYVDIPLIQTDAAINPGNSGGPLVNEYGQVIGINSAKIVAEGFEGIGFAIPVSEAKPIVDDIVTNGRVTGRVKLGISARQIDEIDSRNTGLQMGIRIEEIDPESDLAKQDVQRFDIITHVNGERILTLADLRNILNEFDPGDRVTLTLSRPVSTTRAEEIQVTVTLMEDK